jgi:hypothetical protein
MRAVVGALRDGESGVPTAPQPTLANLDALVRDRVPGGHLEVQGSPRVLPPAVELSAYRVVEHLLDALEEAPGVDVRVRFSDAVVELEVSGPARRRGQAAIERARERVQLHRGTLEATRRGTRAEAIACLPVLAGG